MEKVSKAGFGLLQFVKAVLSFCAVYKEVKPKIERVAQLEKEFNTVSLSHFTTRFSIESKLKRVHTTI